jgi:hypothetical protein
VKTHVREITIGETHLEKVILLKLYLKEANTFKSNIAKPAFYGEVLLADFETAQWSPPKRMAVFSALLGRLGANILAKLDSNMKYSLSLARAREV